MGASSCKIFPRGIGCSNAASLVVEAAACILNRLAWLFSEPAAMSFDPNVDEAFGFIAGGGGGVARQSSTNSRPNTVSEWREPSSRNDEAASTTAPSTMIAKRLSCSSTHECGICDTIHARKPENGRVGQRQTIFCLDLHPGFVIRTTKHLERDSNEIVQCRADHRTCSILKNQRVQCDHRR